MGDEHGGCDRQYGEAARNPQRRLALTYFGRPARADEGNDDGSGATFLRDLFNEPPSRDGVPLLAQEDQLDSLAVLSRSDGHPQASGISLVPRHDGAPLPEQQKAVLGGRDEGELESALGIRDGRRRPFDVLSAGERPDLDSGDGTTLSVENASLHDRVRVRRARDRFRRRPRRRGTAP